MRQSRLACSFPDASTFSDATTRRRRRIWQLHRQEHLLSLSVASKTPKTHRIATMSMKRKRSTGSLFQSATLEASSPTPFASSPIRLPNFFVQSKTHDPQSSPFTPKSYHHESSQHEENTSHTLNSRTRKRYRDARPEESQIHGMHAPSPLRYTSKIC